MADDIVNVKGIRGMLPPSRSTTLPILAIATHVEITILYDKYEMRFSQTGSPISTLTAGIDVSESPSWDPDTGLRDLVECFGRAPLTSLTVGILHPHLVVDAWERVFRTFPLLEDLDIDGEYEFSQVFLGLHAASSKEHEGSSVACPNLRQVSAVGLGVTEAYEAMRECFQYRADRGARLQVLDLSMLVNKDLPSETLCGFVADLRQAVECLRVEDN
ncbi:hypothetical protein GSI_03445 [Ganoderma sinense ZZ0214-1]|uniref:Uncharacterized protein n=1 Tax=Ganoderma sinense ZZ0214-1 TaxID=1077348 RepID=A0A2G8SLL4_9APHY|nr:hypothetical protein GSI_03445 [Ganoderma sinense ZZ0214-1]